MFVTMIGRMQTVYFAHTILAEDFRMQFAHVHFLLSFLVR